MGLEGPAKDAVGIILQILATFLAAAAYVLQKKAHMRTDEANGKSVYQDFLWQMGFVFMVVTALIDVYSFSLLDQSKLAAFGAVTLMWNILLSTLILKEKFTRIDAASVAIICVGTVLALSASEATSKDFTLDEIVGLLDDDMVYAYCSIVGAVIVATTLAIERITRRDPSGWTRAEAFSVAVVSPAVGGLCMGFTGYSAKAISATLSHEDWGQFKHFPIYGYFLLGGIAVSGQVRYLNKGLAFFDAISVVPVFEAAIILSNSLAGITFYRDLRSQPTGDKLMFAAGALLAIAGVNVQLLKVRKGPHGGGRGGDLEDEEDDGGKGEALMDIPLIGASDPVTVLTGVVEEGMYAASGARPRGRSRGSSSAGLAAAGPHGHGGSYGTANIR